MNSRKASGVLPANKAKHTVQTPIVAGAKTAEIPAANGLAAIPAATAAGARAILAAMLVT